jgi:hypothetical protein
MPEEIQHPLRELHQTSIESIARKFECLLLELLEDVDRDNFFFVAIFLAQRRQCS